MNVHKVSLPDMDLAYLTEHTPEFDEYMKDLRWCQDYARENRVEMMRRVLEILARLFNNGRPLTPTSR